VKDAAIRLQMSLEHVVKQWSMPAAIVFVHHKHVAEATEFDRTKWCGSG
jgi:hypothetical protein